MMNMLELQDKLKNFSEEQLVSQMQSPTGDTPQFLVLGEIERRQRMKAEATRQQGTNQPTVAQDVVNAAGVPQGGIADMAQAMAPQTDMTQNTGIMSAAPTAETQRMAAGGVVKMAEGTQIGDYVGPSYIDIITAARNGVRPTLNTLEAVAPYVTTQQALDIQAMIDSPDYIPSEQEVTIATAPAGPITPEPLADPRAGAGLDAITDYAAGVFGGRTLGEQVAIDAQRKAETDAYLAATENKKDRGIPELQNPAIRTALQNAPAPVTAPVTAPVATTPAAPSGGSGSGGIGGISGAASSYEQALMDTLKSREQAQNQDKWLALAQVGLSMMNSQSPDFLGAAGEAGLAGVAAYKQGRDQYDADRLKILGELEDYKMKRAALAARGSGSGGGAKLPSASMYEQYGKLSELYAAAIENKDMATLERITPIMDALAAQLGGTSTPSGVTLDADLTIQ